MSENVGLSHDAALGLPRPPRLSVPDGAGGWREVIPFTGFPGGKTKTIAIDVSGLLDGAAARLRVDTTMEIRWDAAFLAAGETPAPIATAVVGPERASLAFRGRSRIEQDDSGGPERFLYDEVSREPRWPPMRGAFTAHGEVAELVAADDDRLVVMGAGDEMALSFPVPEGPPPGWKRSFLLESVGDAPQAGQRAVGDDQPAVGAGGHRERILHLLRGGGEGHREPGRDHDPTAPARSRAPDRHLAHHSLLRTVGPPGPRRAPSTGAVPAASSVARSGGQRRIRLQ